MRLNSFLPKIEQRYVFVGSAVGTLLPISFFSWAYSNGYTGSFVNWAFENPSQCTLAAMPVWMGLVSLQFARSKRLRLKEAAARRLQERRLFHAANHDLLTGLGNRSALQQTGKALARRGGDWGLLLLDLDKFKYVNDTLGHHAGDELLQQFSARLKSLESNSLSAFRLGGDEFVLLCCDCVNDSGMAHVAEKIATLLREPFLLASGPVSIGASIGIARAKPKDDTLEAAMQRADLALYSAKDVPGSAYTFYEEGLATASLARMEIERDLASAVENGEFVLEFQPIIGTEKGEVRAMEALVRWQHPVKGITLPERFMPVAERCGLSAKIDRWVLQAACQEATKWPLSTGVSVNVSRALFEDQGFATQLLSCLDKTGLSPGRLTIEISEPIVSLNPELVRKRLEQLKVIGVRVALDDFGLGLSSLNCLMDFQVDRLKLDRSFVAGILSDARGAGLMDVMMQFGSALKMATAIEGIEDERQMEFVRQRGASEVQGYLFSGPVPANEVTEFLRHKSMISNVAA
jgi:diguanylate cyclase (GGDEF)-like protein